mgnify:CR=1 FL=1|jgi:hypothetical protein
MNDIIFVTAYKDIGRSEWPSISRTIESYCDSFYNYASRINYILLVFVDETIKQYLQSKYTLPSNILFYDINACYTFFDKYIDIERNIISHTNYKDKIPSDRKNCPEHTYAEYNLINHNKINYVNQAKNLYPNYKFYSWIDFGLKIKSNSKLFASLNTKNMPSKIIYQHVSSNLPQDKMYILPEKEDATDPNHMLASHVIYFAGSIFIVHTDLVTIYEKLYEEKLQELQKKEIVDDDQNIVLQIFLDNKELFYMAKVKDHPNLNIHLGLDEWFKLYELF